MPLSPLDVKAIFALTLEKDSMNFKMYINKDLVENIPLAKTQVELPGYIQGLRLLLEEKHESIIKQSKEKPEYYIDGIESRMNLGTYLLN